MERINQSSVIFFRNTKHSPSADTHMFEVLEGDELDDVAQDRLALGRPQDPVVAVQDLHVGEVGVAHADDDDGHGEVGGVHDGLPRVGHVGDDAVGQDEQDEVLLVKSL